MGYTNKDREAIIKNSIRAYRNTIMFGIDKDRLSNVINEMENVRIMCLPWSVKGICELEETIREAKEKLGR